MQHFAPDFQQILPSPLPPEEEWPPPWQERASPGENLLRSRVDLQPIGLNMQHARGHLPHVTKMLQHFASSLQLYRPDRKRPAFTLQLIYSDMQHIDSHLLRNEMEWLQIKAGLQQKEGSPKRAEDGRFLRGSASIQARARLPRRNQPRERSFET